MPDLPSFTPNNLIRVLEKIGFIMDRSKGSHRLYYHPKTKRRVIIPFHRKDIPKGTFFEILRQAGITKEELKNFIK